MNELQIFSSEEFGDIRTVTINGDPYFVGKDVAAILGYSNSRKALADHVDDEDEGVTKCDTLGGAQELTVINESGLYSLILSSKLPGAKRFKRWVTSEVLPSIRKNGGYIAGQEELSDDELIARAILVANRKIEERDRIIQQKQERIEEMRPKEIFADAVTASKSSILIRDLAMILHQNGIKTSERRLYKWMRERGYIMENSTMPTQRAREMGLFEIKETTIIRGDDSPMVKATTKVTGKGQQYFLNKFLSGVT